LQNILCMKNFKTLPSPIIFTNHKISAFTLVELAIVIIIIGAILGGVLQGKELIKQTEIRTVVKDIESYKSAYLSFKDKYNCLPGDCINARIFFSSTDCPDVAGYTCNGNGNNLLTGDNAEGARFWQHLSLSKFLKGTYQGYYNGNGSNYLAVVVPQGPVKGMGYGAFGLNFFQFWTGLPSESRNYIRIGGVIQSGATTRIDPPKLTSYDANIIDTKIDDGIPGRGKIMIEPHISGNCITTSNVATSVYTMQDTTIGCVPAFLLD
jgi:type II secretory pathway pseudopilin PulG